MREDQHLGSSQRNSKESVLPISKGGVYFSPQIHRLFRDKHFNRILCCNEKRVYNDFRFLATIFLINNKANKYNKRVGNLLFSYHKLGCNMSLKTLSLNGGQDIFPENCEALNDENGECFHYGGPAMWRTYQGKCSSPILAECCLRIAGNSPVVVYKRQVKRSSINEG